MKVILIQIGVCILVLICVLSMCLVKTDDKITSKYLFYQIASSSMNGSVNEYSIDSFNKEDIIIVEKNITNEFYSNLKVGDVITFQMNAGDYNGEVITHRIIQIEKGNDNYYIKTKGDNSFSIEILNSIDDVIYGKVILTSSFLGILFNFVTNVFVLSLLIVLPCLFLIIKEILKIKKIINKNRRENE